MVDKRTMHEPSIRIPLLVRYPAPDAARAGRGRSSSMVLHRRPGPEHSRPLRRRAAARTSTAGRGRTWCRAATRTGGRRCFYEYNYEKQFPYTPNVRGVRTDRLEVHPLPARRRRARPPHGRAVRPESRPRGAAQPDRRPADADRLTELHAELSRQMNATGLDKDDDAAGRGDQDRPARPENPVARMLPPAWSGLLTRRDALRVGAAGITAAALPLPGLASTQPAEGEVGHRPLDGRRGDAPRLVRPQARRPRARFAARSARSRRPCPASGSPSRCRGMAKAANEIALVRTYASGQRRPLAEPGVRRSPAAR